MIIQKARATLELADLAGGLPTGTSSAVGDATKESGDAPNWSPLPKALAVAAMRMTGSNKGGLLLLAKAVVAVANDRHSTTELDPDSRRFRVAAAAFWKAIEG